MWLCCCDTPSTYTLIKYEIDGGVPVVDWRGISSGAESQFTNTFRSDQIRRIVESSGRILGVNGGWESGGSVAFDAATGIDNNARWVYDVSAAGLMYGWASGSTAVRKIDTDGSIIWTADPGPGADYGVSGGVSVGHSTAGVYVGWRATTDLGASVRHRLTLMDESGSRDWEIAVGGYPGFGLSVCESIGSDVYVSRSTGAGAARTLLSSYDSNGDERWHWPLDSDYEDLPGVMFAKNGSIYLTCRYQSDRHIVKVSTSGTEEAKYNLTSAGFSAYPLFDIDGSGNIFTSRLIADATKMGLYDTSFSLQWSINHGASGIPQPYVGSDGVYYAGWQFAETT